MKKRIHALDEWLAIATRKLSHVVKERISMEIEAHFAGAVEVHKGGGYSEQEARTLALEELGDAYAARKEYRKTCLSESEDRRLRRILDRDRTRTFMLGSLLLGLLCIKWLSDTKPLDTFNGFITASLVFIFMVIAPMTAVILSKRQNCRRAASWLLVSETLSGLAMLYCLVNFAFSRVLHENGFPFGMMPFLIPLLFLLDVYKTILLARKIPKDWSSSLPDNIEHAK